MTYRDLTLVAAKGIATNINYAVWSRDRTMMLHLSRKHGGIRNITRVLVAGGVMTSKQRIAAIGMLPRVNNPSMRWAI